jgi:hypothetical protein
MAKKLAVKKVNMKSPEFQKESRRMDRMPKASGRADFDPTGQLLLAGRAGLAVLGGAGFGGGVKRTSINLSKSPKKTPPVGIEPPSINSSLRKSEGLATKTPKKLVGTKIRKPIIKKK